MGVHVVRHLQNMGLALESVKLLDGGTLSFILAGPIEEAENLIVIDAAQLDCAPGTVRLFEGEDMDRFVLSGRHSSVHEVSLSDLLVIAHLSGRLPRRRALIGVQPELIDWSDTLTEPVANAIAVACDRVQGLLTRWTEVRRPVSQKTLLQKKRDLCK